MQPGHKREPSGVRPDEPVLIAYFWVCLTFELAASAFVKPLESRPVCAEEEMMSDRVGPRAAAWGAEMGERVPKSAHVCGMIRRFRVSPESAFVGHGPVWGPRGRNLAGPASLGFPYVTPKGPCLAA